MKYVDGTRKSGLKCTLGNLTLSNFFTSSMVIFVGSGMETLYGRSGALGILPLAASIVISTMAQVVKSSEWLSRIREQSNSARVDFPRYNRLNTAS